MKFAIIETGGKQYRVKEGDTVLVEKLEGESQKFENVLLVAEGDEVQVGTPYVKGAHVEATVAGAVRGERKIIFRYHSKTRYRKLKTHRQDYTKVTITKVK